MSRLNSIAFAELAVQAQRYEDVTDTMKRIIQTGQRLEENERNIFAAGYRNLSALKRHAWRVLASIGQKAEMENQGRTELVTSYAEHIQSEIESLCNEVIRLLDSFLIKSTSDNEDLVFYYKMKGDYYRYMAEIFSEPEKRTKVISSANKAYSTALNMTAGMPSIHPIKLGLALNYSVFLYEIKQSEKKAATLAKSAFDAAIAQVNLLHEDFYADSTLMMQLLRENLALWSATIRSNEHRDE